MLDDFETLRDWHAVTSDGVALEIASDTGRGGRVMRMDVDFRGGGGYAIAQKVFIVDLTANYEFSFQVRGDIGPNDLEFKLVDPGGENVWWRNQRTFEFPREWRRVTNRKRQMEFAWGPAGGGDMRRVAVIEIAVTAGSGGRGTVWLDDLIFRPLPPERPYDLVPAASASSSRRGNGAERVLRPGASSVWRSAAGGEQWLMLDFLRSREIGGLVIDWARGEQARDYSVQVSEDGREWETRYAVSNGASGRDHIHIPETEGRYLRLAMSRGAAESYAVASLDVKPADWAPTRNDFLAEVAKDFPRGSFPRHLSGEQSYWTVVGVDGGRNEALLSEDGALELGRGLASIEPFLHVAGGLVTWNDVATRQTLERGSLPVPSVHWDAAPLALTVTAWATGVADSATLHARYRVTNRSSSATTGSLFLAIRPFQVNPPWQFLNLQGGAARVRILEHDGRLVYLNAIERRIVPVSTPSGFGAAGFDQGDVTEYLRAGIVPPFSALSDDAGRVSGALAFALSLSPGETRDIYIDVPLDRAGSFAEPRQSDADARAHGEAKLAEAIATWERTLGRVTVELPPSARRVSETLRSTLAYILINRDGPAIQPGSRSYERSWIRDGSLTSAALLRLGHPEPVRQFAEWYAPFQYPNGKVPCCVDARGADPVPEHDSHGQLIYLITEYYRYTGDRAFAERMWPHVSRSVAYIDSLRRERMTDEYRFQRRAYFGMVPESISHEGYSAKPMHSYWDAFFVLKGLKDAAWLAAQLDRDVERTRIARMRDEFRRDLLQSFQLTMEEHGIDYLAGSVELGDFDATSTTVGITPAGELARLPREAVERTFERYLEETTARVEGRREWDAYTPYELRTVGTFVRLGRKADAHRLLNWFFADQRPPGWNHWAEVVWRDARAPRFIGDMPHTWVGSDFIRSVLDMFVYEREADESIVIGEGIPEAWAREDSGVAIRNVRTYYGQLSYTVRAAGSEATYQLSGELAVPYGGMVIRSPIDSPVREALVDGRPAARNEAGEIVVYGVPATVVLRH
ncbi:MAG TPA: discoidin domain-containing protein [Gemmatimonadaceae bacterium]|nr:discoidin domain-containing protein [Gemmatimonadaceae bacterium]